MSDDNWRNDLVEAFDRFDADKNGAIDKDELDALLTALGSTMSSSDREVGFRMIDKNNDGLISLAELAPWWEVVRSESS